MTQPRLTFESIAWAAVLGLAAFLRFHSLDSKPLQPAEAPEALAAAVGTPQESMFWDLDHQPSATSATYYVLTKGIFAVGGADEGAARAVPAVAGLVPLVVVGWFRRRIGAVCALALGVILAVSPSLVAISRMAGGSSLAVAALGVAALTAVEANAHPSWSRRALFGLSMGFGFASGPAFLTGVLGLGLTSFLARRTLAALKGRPSWSGGEWGEIGLWSIGGAAVASSALGLVPSGLTVLFSGLQTWLMGWVRPGSLPLVTALLLFVAYEPLATFLGAAEVIRSSRRGDLLGRWLGVWTLVAVILFLARVGRGAEDIVWPLIPLAVTAARLVGRELRAVDDVASPWVAASLLAVLLLMSGYIHQQLSAYASGLGPTVAADMAGLRLPIAAGAIGVAAVVTVLVGLGWDWATARAGGMGAIILVLLAAMTSSSWSLNISHDPDLDVELWMPRQTATGLDRVRTTLESLAYFQTGTRSMPITISRSAVTPALAWTLRGFGEFVPGDVGSDRAPPAMLLSEGEPLPSLPAEYLGQGMTFEHAWGWEEAWPPQPLSWWLRRSGPMRATRWVLYVREDLATLAPSTEVEAP